MLGLVRCWRWRCWAARMQACQRQQPTRACASTPAPPAAVVLEPPRLQDLPRWEGCFISSTSRLVLPVDEATPMLDEPLGGAEAGAAAVPAPRTFARGGLVSRLEQLVLAEVEAASEPLFD